MEWEVTAQEHEQQFSSAHAPVCSCVQCTYMKHGSQDNHLFDMDDLPGSLGFPSTSKSQFTHTHKNNFPHQNNEWEVMKSKQDSQTYPFTYAELGPVASSKSYLGQFAGFQNQEESYLHDWQRSREHAQQEVVQLRQGPVSDAQYQYELLYGRALDAHPVWEKQTQYRRTENVDSGERRNSDYSVFPGLEPLNAMDSVWHS